MFEIILLLVFLVIVCQIVYTSIKIGISPMPSSFKACQIMNELSRRSKETTIVDVGSGFGFLGLFFALKNPTKKIIGYEVSLFPWVISLVLKCIFRCDNLFFYKRNFLKINFPKNCLIICYLFPEGMKTLEKKLETRNLKIISNTFTFKIQKHKKIVRVNDLYQTPIYVY